MTMALWALLSFWILFLFCTLLTMSDCMADEVNTIFVHGNIVGLKVSPDTSFNDTAYIVYKQQGCRHHRMSIPCAEFLLCESGLLGDVLCGMGWDVAVK